MDEHYSFPNTLEHISPRTFWRIPPGGIAGLGGAPCVGHHLRIPIHCLGNATLKMLRRWKTAKQARGTGHAYLLGRGAAGTGSQGRGSSSGPENTVPGGQGTQQPLGAELRRRKKDLGGS